MYTYAKLNYIGGGKSKNRLNEFNFILQWEGEGVISINLCMIQVFRYVGTPERLSSIVSKTKKGHGQ